MKRARLSSVTIAIACVFVLSLPFVALAQDPPPANAADSAGSTEQAQAGEPSAAVTPEIAPADTSVAEPEKAAEPVTAQPEPEPAAAPAESAPDAGVAPAKPGPTAPEGTVALTEPDLAVPEAGTAPATVEPATPPPAEPEAQPEPAQTEVSPADETTSAPTANYSGVWRALKTLKRAGSSALALSVSGPRLAPTMPPPSVTPPSPLPVTGPLRAPGASAPEGPHHAVLYGRPSEVYVLEKDGTMHTYSPRDLVFRNQPGFHLSSLPRPERATVLYSENEGAAAPPTQAEREDQGGTGPVAEAPGPRQAEAGGEPGAEAEPQAGAEGQQEPQPPKEGEAGENAEESAGTGKAAEEGAPATAGKSTKTAPLSAAQKRAKEAKNEDIERMKQMRRQGVWFYNPDGTPMTNQQLDDRLSSGNIEGIKTVDRYQSTWSAKDDYTPEEDSGTDK